jgi:SAM-dependent methyltransferase
MFRLAASFFISNAIYVAAKLGIADLLAQGPRTATQLAHTTNTHAGALRRVLRLLVNYGIFTEHEAPASGSTAAAAQENPDPLFSLTPLGATLRADVPGSTRAGALLYGGLTQRPWNDLLYSVTTGEPSFHHVYGKSSFEYLAEHPDQARNFDLAMSDFTTQLAISVAAAYDFSHFTSVTDIGGGNGTLLIQLLNSNPKLHGTVFDQPQVIERTTEHIRRLGFSDRLHVVAGNFFESIPEGSDAYTFKHVIHDWNDEQARAILQTCRRAMRPGAKLLIIEGVYPPHIDQSENSRGATANDVNMLVCTGGRQRTEHEFQSLLASSGFRLARIIPTPSRVAIIESSPA